MDARAARKNDVMSYFYNNHWSEIRYTDHARKRMQERDIDEYEVEQVIERGERVRDGGSFKVEIPEERLDDTRLDSRLRRVVVVLTTDTEAVKTVYRRDAPGTGDNAFSRGYTRTHSQRAWQRPIGLQTHYSSSCEFRLGDCVKWKKKQKT
ncbi:DUF4258 domain-containing protein [Lujinxingia sediminis]|uniref:DUF4258 domain-containing protein n=2 Tax=Lujinxingia sediminis TaxID=2480984 RepID=A0ABY0CUC0_9DELT|nr:DUF4258 domain-containing protein [Lujinxingia sediminis]